MLNVPNADSAGWRFDNSYASLPGSLHSVALPVPACSPSMVLFNDKLASLLGLDAGSLRRDGADLFAGNRLPPGSRPISQAYAGHQFGHFINLGDGRAILLGEQISPDGKRHDIQLKGSGRTPYSRQGDGRAALGPMLREYLVGEAMHALGIPTSRGMAVVMTGEDVIRDAPLPGAVLTRVASSHIRVGTFEYAAATGERGTLKALVSYALKRHYHDAAEDDNEALALLEGVMRRQAELVARWMCVGFVHGVMNTDNMSVSGETIDYGPCAFLDTYDPGTVFSSIDHWGRYAYGNQPDIAHWNLARFAEALLSVIDDDHRKAVDRAMEVLGRFPELFRKHHEAGLSAKIGLMPQESGDPRLAGEFLELMREKRADFTASFSALTEAAETGHPDAFPFSCAESAGWYARWRACLERQVGSREEMISIMRQANPEVIPRNHRVEEALQAAQSGDYSPIQRLLDALETPYRVTPDSMPFREAPLPGGPSYRTFCGT